MPALRWSTVLCYCVVYLWVYVCVCVYGRACVRACARACVHALYGKLQVDCVSPDFTVANYYSP